MIRAGELYDWGKLAKLPDLMGFVSSAPVVNVTRDIVDYFTDIAKATDDREMGGFLLGQARKIGETPVIQLYDYIQTPNDADFPTISFRPPIESFREVHRLIKEGRYNVLAGMHTHPSDTWFSIGDVRSAFYRVRDFWVCCGLRFPEEVVFFLKRVPDFLVTGGEIGYVMSYTGYMPYVLRFQSDERELIAETYIREWITEPPNLVELPRRARERFPLESDEFYSFVERLCYTDTRVVELEAILVPLTIVKNVIGMLEEDYRRHITEGKFDIARLLDELVSMLRRGEILPVEFILQDLLSLGYSARKVETIKNAVYKK